jgi:hypothetical protein
VARSCGPARGHEPTRESASAAPLTAVARADRLLPVLSLAVGDIVDSWRAWRAAPCGASNGLAVQHHDATTPAPSPPPTVATFGLVCSVRHRLPQRPSNALPISGEVAAESVSRCYS